MTVGLRIVSAELKDEKDTALVVVIQLRRENMLLRAKNYCLKEEAAKAFNDANKDLYEVIRTSKT